MASNESNFVSTSSKRKRAVIWEYFTETLDNEASCNICTVKIKTKTGNTTNMIKHLSLHVHVYNEYMQTFKKLKTESQKQRGSKEAGQLTLKGSFNKHTTLSSDDPKARMITEQIAMMMAIDFQPFSIVNDRGFRGVLKAAEPRYEIPDRTTFSRAVIPQLYEKTKHALKTKLQEDIQIGISSLTYTSDTWTSRAAESYISLTAHYLKKDFTPVYLVLANSSFSESHTADNILAKLEDVEREWDIPRTGLPIYVVTDNAANIRAAIARSRWTAVQCFAHTLQLAIVDAKKDTPGVVEICAKGKAIVGHFNRSTTAQHQLHKLQIQMGKPVHKLIQDVDTRWNSEHAMLCRLVEQKEPISAYLSSDMASNTNVDSLSINEWKLAAGVTKVLQPLFEATEKMSGEKYPTMSLMIPLLHGITSIIRKFVVSASAGQGIMFAKNLLKALNSRFPNLFKDEDIPIFAMIVDPRFKAVLLDATEKEDVIERLIMNVPTVTSTPIGTTIDLVTCEAEDRIDNTLGSGLWDDFDQIVSAAKQCAPTDQDVPILKKEFLLFTSEPVISRNDCPLQYWKANCTRYPELSKVALQYLGIPGTQVPSERLFSSSGNTVTVRRTCLTHEHVEKLTFLNGNL